MGVEKESLEQASITLDVISASVPALCCFWIIHTKGLLPWAKLLISNALLTAGKGLVGCLTIVPDADGCRRPPRRLACSSMVSTSFATSGDSVLANAVPRPASLSKGSAS